MALQDLTPQLRTRLSRMERAVGWFIVLATLLLVFGFGYYIRNTAKRKGWFVPKATYFTFTDRATGLKVGDPVVLMGFEVGQVTKIDTMPPWSPYNVYLEFEVKERYNGYLWTGHRGSRVKVAGDNLLGKRVVEVTKGYDGHPAYSFHPREEITLAEAQAASRPERWLTASQLYDVHGTNLVLDALKPLTKDNLSKFPAGVQKISVLDTNRMHKVPTVVWSDAEGGYVRFISKDVPEQKLKANLYWLVADETPAITEQLQGIVETVQKALPNILALTNQLNATLAHSTSLTSNLNDMVQTARPVATNLAEISLKLREPGAIGEWMLGVAGQRQLRATIDEAYVAITNANMAITNVDANLAELLDNLGRSLDNLAGITSNLHAQVQANTNIVSSISKMIVDADDMVQGLKRHWLLRSAFKTKTPPPAPATNAPPLQRLKSPRDPAAP